MEVPGPVPKVAGEKLGVHRKASLQPDFLRREVHRHHHGVAVMRLEVAPELGAITPLRKLREVGVGEGPAPGHCLALVRRGVDLVVFPVSEVPVGLVEQVLPSLDGLHLLDGKQGRVVRLVKEQGKVQHRFIGTGLGPNQGQLRRGERCLTLGTSPDLVEA